MTNRLNATLNFICTYEKVITINNTIIDIVDEFSVEDGKVIIYGYHDTYEFVFSSVDINVKGAHVDMHFCGERGGSIYF